MLSGRRRAARSATLRTCYDASKAARAESEAVAKFQLNGFLKVENVLSADEVASLGDHADLIAAGKATHIPDTSLQLETVFRDGTTAVADRVLATRKLFNMAVHDDLLWRHATIPRSWTSSPTCSAPTTSRCTATSCS